MMVFSITLVAAATNISLNFVLIPRMGLMGAVWTTVISFTVLGALRAATCPRGLLCFPQWRPLLVASGCAVLLVSVIKWSNLLGVEHVWLRLFVAGVMFLLLYALPVWLLDPSFRAAVQAWRRGVAK
jgi:O-antigen/teichoic acid export membrane protein